MSTNATHDPFSGNKNIQFYRKAFTYAAIGWALWIVPLKLGKPTWDHKIEQRLLLSAFMGAVVGLTYVNEWSRRKIEFLAFFIACLFTAFQASLPFHNGLNPTRAFTNILLISVACMMFNSRKYLLLYYAFGVTIWSSTFWVPDAEFSRPIFFLSVLLCKAVYLFTFESKLALTKNLSATEQNLKGILNAFPDEQYVFDEPNLVTSMKREDIEQAEKIEQHFPENVTKKIQDGAASHLDFIVDFENLKENQMKAWEVRGVPLQKSQTLLVVRDVTEIRESERKKEKQKNELVNALRLSSVSQMLRGIKIELKPWILKLENQVVDIKSTCEIKESSDVSLLEGKVTDLQQTSEKIAKKVLVLRRFAEDSSSEKRAPMNFATIVEEALELVRGRIELAGCSLRVEGTNEEAKINGRMIELTQVMFQLLEHVFEANHGVTGCEYAVLLKNKGDVLTLSIETNKGYTFEQIDENDETLQDVKSLHIKIGHGILKEHDGNLELTSSKKGYLITLPKLAEDATYVEQTVRAA